jgi:uncharacterized protein (TIGR03663 family)
VTTSTRTASVPRPSPRAAWKPRSSVRLALRGETLAYGGLVVAALALRLVALTDRPLHHDESEHTYFSLLFAHGHGYRYDPILHGPLRDLTTGLVFAVFGASDLTARIVPVLLGAVLVTLPYLLRRQLGQFAALATATLLCVSPTFLYYTRFDREDPYALVLTLGLVAAVFRFLDSPRRWQPALILGLLAASFATKETTYFTVFVMGTFFLAVAAREGFRVRRGESSIAETRLLGPVVAVGRNAWIWGIATFLAVFMLLFTTFFTNPAGLQDGLVESIRYWLSQQPVGRGSQPWFYYFVLLGGYELPAVAAALVGVVVALRRPSLLRLYLVWAAVLDLIVYTWASEKMPWLLMHPLLPILLLAGIGLAELWRERRRLAAKVGLGLVGALLVPMLWGAISLNYRHPADPAEVLVFTQTSPDLLRADHRLHVLETRLAASAHRPLRLDVDTRYALDWPWWWYLRDFRRATYADMSDPAYLPSVGADALLVADDDRARVLPQLRGFTGYRFHHRVWWVPDYGGVDAGKLFRWFVFRKPWNQRGSVDEWLYVRRSVARLAPGARA